MATARDIELIATVLSKILSDDGYPFDNIFSRIPLIKYMLLKDSKDGGSLGTNNRVRKLDGGLDIEIPLEYAVGNSMQFFDGMDKITFTLKETDTNAKYDWKHGAQTLLMDRKDILKCQGNSAKLENLVGSKIRNMNKSMATTLNGAILNGAPGAKDIHSIPIIVDYIPTGARTIGGIDQSAAANAFWRNKTSASTAATWAALMAELDALYYSIIGNVNEDGPDLFVTSLDFFKCLINYARAKGTHTFVSDEIDNIFNLGGKSLKINGASVIWDSVAEPAAEAAHSAGYYLNTDYLQFVVHQDRQFELEGPQKMTFQGQDAIAWVIFLMCNLTCSNRSKQGVLYSVDHTIAA